MQRELQTTLTVSLRKKMLAMSLLRMTVMTSLAAVTLAAQSDTTPPQLLNLGFSPTVVDVTSSAQAVNFALHVTDDLSGIDSVSGNRISVALRSPSGQSAFGIAVPQPGVVLDATFAITVTFPQFGEPGTWTVFQVRLRDNAGNQVFLNTAALAAAGFPTALTVIDATPDIAPPQLAAVSLSPSVVDVSAASATITVDLQLTDDLSGIDQSGTNLQDFAVTSPSGNQMRFISIRQFQRISGTATNGVWRATMNMPRYSEPGVWKATSVRLTDKVRSQHLYTPVELASFGSSIELNVASSLFDGTPPQLTAISFTPLLINTSLGPQTVQVDLGITDDLSGVSFSGDTPFVSATIGTRFQSPSGAQSAFTNSNFSLASLVSGTPLNGTWRSNAFFPQFAEAGTWQANASFKDAVRNQAGVTSAQLASLGLPSSLVVIRPSLQTDGTITSPAAGGTVSDSTFGTRAQLIVPPGVLSQPTSIAIDVLQSPLNLPLPTGFSTAETFFVNVQLTPQPTFPLPAPGMSVVLPLRNYIIPGTAIDLFRVDPSTGNLVPALDTSGNPVVGMVDAGGLTATFAGVARFSTVVGLLRGAIQVVVDIKPGESTNAINTKSKGKIPVAILSKATLDVTKVDPATLRLSGASVAQNKKGKYQFSITDVDMDGLDDVVVHFETEQLLLRPGDPEALVEGRTQDGRYFRGTDSVRIVK